MLLVVVVCACPGGRTRGHGLGQGLGHVRGCYHGHGHGLVVVGGMLVVVSVFN